VQQQTTNDLRTRTVSTMVVDARMKIENLDVADAAREIAAGGVTVIDLREPAEIDATGSIPGAVLVPRGMLEFRADPTSAYHQVELDPSRRTLLVCASGGRSALATLTLQQMGYLDVAHIDGGMAAWRDLSNAAGRGEGSR